MEVEQVDLDFRGPHVAVALARGEAWDGLPLMSAWLGGEIRTDSDWEALNCWPTPCASGWARPGR